MAREPGGPPMSLVRVACSFHGRRFPRDGRPPDADQTLPCGSLRFFSPFRYPRSHWQSAYVCSPSRDFAPLQTDHRCAPVNMYVRRPETAMSPQPPVDARGTGSGSIACMDQLFAIVKAARAIYNTLAKSGQRTSLFGIRDSIIGKRTVSPRCRSGTGGVGFIEASTPRFFRADAAVPPVWCRNHCSRRQVPFPGLHSWHWP